MLIAYNPDVPIGPAIDQLHPYKGALSGEKEDQKPSYNYGPKSTKYPIIALKDDIVAPDGRGLKKGFYEVRIDKNYEFLLLVQAGVLKAKIPVISLESAGRNQAPKEEKVLNSKQMAKQMRKEYKKAKKDEKKYLKGENPKDIINSSAEIFYDRVSSSWVIMWEVENLKAVGCFRIQ